MGIRKIYLLAILSLVYATSARAQPAIQFDGETQDSFQTITSALSVLTGDNNVAAGTYKLKSNVENDGDLDLYKILGEIPLGDENAQFVPLIEIDPSYLKFDQNISDTETMGSVNVDSWGIGAGAGLQMKFLCDLLHVIPRFKVQYSEIKFDFDIDGVDDSIVDDIVPDIDTWSYNPSLEIGLRQKLADDEGTGLFNSTYSYLYVDASTSNDNLDNFSSHSMVWRNRLAYEQPVDKFILRPNVGRVDIYGDARDGFEFGHFYEFGMDFLSRKYANDIFKEIGVGVTYVWEKEIQGWRFGVLGKFA